MQTTPSPVRIGAASIGGDRLALIAGPCVIESKDHCLRMAERLRELTGRLEMPFVFKASYDKANRSSLSSYRGPGLEDGLAILERVKAGAGVPVLSDIHEPTQAAPAGEVLDCLQVPAFLSRQTDLLVAAAKTGVPVAVKKGQFMAPWDMAPVLGKLRGAGAKDILLVERGTFFGYNNLVSDLRSLPILRGLGAPCVFDATHSVQLPGGQGESSGGDRAMAPVLARAAVAAGVDALFLEVHDDPESAKCDGPNMIPLAELEALLSTVLAIDEVVRT